MCSGNPDERLEVDSGPACDVLDDISLVFSRCSLSLINEKAWRWPPLFDLTSGVPSVPESHFRSVSNHTARPNYIVF